MATQLSILCLLCITVGVYSYAGEYIPKSYYVISNGHRSDPVYLRAKRSTLHLLRKRRSPSNPSIPGVPNPDQLFDFVNKVSHGDFQGLPGFNPGAFQGGNGGFGYGSGSGSHAYSFSSASGGGGPAGPRNTHHYSNAGPDSPNEFARSGEARGHNVRVSGSASGPNGAFSSSSASSDGQGNVRYSVHNKKY